MSDQNEGPKDAPEEVCPNDGTAIDDSDDDCSTCGATRDEREDARGEDARHGGGDED